MYENYIINQLWARDKIQINVRDLAGEGVNSTDFLGVSRVILFKCDQ